MFKMSWDDKEKFEKALSTSGKKEDEWIIRR